MQQRDYIQRLIEQIAGTIARIMGFAGQQKFEDAERELDGAWSSIGFRRADAETLDDGTLRILLGPKVELAARLLDAEADVEIARGNHARADVLRRRASSLR